MTIKHVLDIVTPDTEVIVREFGKGNATIAQDSSMRLIRNKRICAMKFDFINAVDKQVICITV